MRRLFTLVLLSLLQISLSACTSLSQQQPVSAVDSNAVQAHQQQLQALTEWRLQGQLALFDLTNEKRHSMYIDWQHSPALTSLRFSHPLQGTLARLQQTPAGAVLIDNDDNHYYGNDAETLLYNYFQLALPFNLLSDIMLGRQQPSMQQPQYLLANQQQPPLALLTGYSIDAGGQRWQVQLTNYRAIQALLLPQQFELTTRQWRLKLRVNQWQF
jgi:outer membrane lipoprotein LolB